MTDTTTQRSPPCLLLSPTPQPYTGSSRRLWACYYVSLLFILTFAWTPDATYICMSMRVPYQYTTPAKGDQYDSYTAWGPLRRYEQTVKRWTVGASGALQENGTSMLVLLSAAVPMYGWPFSAEGRPAVDRLPPTDISATRVPRSMTRTYVANSTTSSTGTANTAVEQWLTQMCSGSETLSHSQGRQEWYYDFEPVDFPASILRLTLDTCGQPTHFAVALTYTNFDQVGSPGWVAGHTGSRAGATCVCS